jgi:uncharacterized protein YkwD
MPPHTPKLAAALLVALAILATMSGAAGAGTAESASATAASAGARQKTLVHATLRLINAARHRHGLSGLRQSDQLTTAGLRHSRDMVRRRYFSHDTPEGASFVDRIRATGYLPTHGRWFVGETLAWGSRRRAAPAATVRAWLHSPPHRHVMLNPSFREVGIGVVLGVPRPRLRGATYTADFGVRAGG